VKTTLEIPDPIFREAKARAATLGVPLREYITEAVKKLRATPCEQEKPWMRYAGALKHLHSETVKIKKIIDEEFG
jgi:hypothetical protein